MSHQRYNNREVLVPNVSNKSTFYNNKNWYQDKQKLIKKYNNKCCFCGNGYDKYMTLINIGEKREISCHLCNAVNNMNIDPHKLVLVDSKLKQIEIINKTADYLKLHNRIPTIAYLDANAKK